ncbi:armadillo repeat-containing protein 3 [Aulostomus maculatus]
MRNALPCLICFLVAYIYVVAACPDVKPAPNFDVKKFGPLGVEVKTPATVVLLLSSLEEDILAKACEAIYAFAEKGDKNKVSLLELGALQRLCQLITHNNKQVRRNAIMALGTMAKNSDVKSVLKQLDVIPSIINQLSLEGWFSYHNPNTFFQEFATLCLSSLSVDFICKVQIFDNKGLPPLIQLLSSPDPDVQKNSLETIYNQVQDCNSRWAMLELSGIPPLLELLKSDYPVIQLLALKTLQNITTDKDTHATFREEKGFEKLLNILNNESFSDLHAAALQVVANCMSNRENLELIQTSGGLTCLMEFLTTVTLPEIQSSVCKCIARVAQSSENCKQLHEQNVEKSLVELLSVPNDDVKTAICQAAAAMSFHGASKDSFRDLGGFPAVVALLSSKNVALREAATEALSNLTSNHKLNAMAVFEAKGHTYLVQQLQDSCPRTVANAAATLSNMAGQEVIRCSILQHGVIQALVEPLKSTDTQVLISTTQCLAELACDADARTELQRAAGLHLLVNLLRTDNKEVLKNACLAVSVCAQDELTAVEMCNFGALEMLQEINKSTNLRSRFSEMAINSLLNSSLSLKYILTGHLASTDIITDGFYDAGKVLSGQRISTLEELSKQPLNTHRPIIVVNTATEETVDVAEDRQSSASKTDTSCKGHRKTSRKRKEEDKQKEETQPQFSKESQWKMMEDSSLRVLVKEAKESILPLKDEREQFAALARLVSDTMGGAVEWEEEMQEFSWVLPLSELMSELKSNIVPIGMIETGIYSHRALLYKCLADYTGMSCTLVRGEYNRAWNEVLLKENSSRQSCSFIVDLMHQPGRLLEANTPAAFQYQYT